MLPSIVFFGTPHFGAELLAHLVDHNVPIKGVVTQPDRPKGRSLQRASSPVKEIWQERLAHVPLWQPEKCSQPDFLAEIAAVHADLYVVVAFGQILPQKLLSIPPLGCINVHASLLPKYRGAAPIHRALLAGEKKTGIAIQKMVKELDAGDVIVAKSCSVPEEMTFGELEQTLCALSKSLLLDVIHRYSKGIPEATPQDLAGVTYASKIEPEEGEIHWTQTASSLHNLTRAFNPRPGAWVWVEINGVRKRLKIFRTKVSHMHGSAGEILAGKELTVGCGDGALVLLEVQLEGKPRMSGADWLRGVKTIRFIRE